MFNSPAASVQCCMCGVAIEPNPSNMCIDCLRSRANFTDTVPSTSSVVYCKSCGRYQTGPAQWQEAQLESPELMQICLKKLTNMKDVQIKDAQFLYTEPHSRRIRVSLTLEKEAFNGTILRQTLIITFVVSLMQCPQCCESATPREHWIANVQIRQHAKNKRTMFWLEQQILTHHAHRHSSTIERKSHGVDFHFAEHAHALKFANFIKSRVPLAPFDENHKLMGEDIKSGTKDSRYSFCLTVPPFCRQDLVFLPKELVKKTGNQCIIGVCLRVTRLLKFIDPSTGIISDMDGHSYWKRPFEPILSLDSLRRYVVINVEPVGAKTGRFQLADIEVTDEDTYQERQIVRSHLGGIFYPNDIALGYDMRVHVFTDDVESALKGSNVPTIVLVGKADDRKKHHRKRKWHLKTLAPVGSSDQEDLEGLMDDLEQDPELRQDVTFYQSNVAPNDPDVLETAIAISEMRIDPNPDQPTAFIPNPYGDP